jgi:hypothetical protein
MKVKHVKLVLKMYDHVQQNVETELLKMLKIAVTVLKTYEIVQHLVVMGTEN